MTTEWNSQVICFVALVALTAALGESGSLRWLTFALRSKLRSSQQQRSSPMGVQIVMDRNGDTRHEFDVSDTTAIALAEERFKELTGRGFRAVALGEDGRSGELISKFDPRVEETLFIPQLQGG